MTSLPKIGAGSLRHLAEVQRQAQTVTAAGGTSVVWQKERDIWCFIRPLSTRLALEARAREPRITHEIIARQQDDVDATKRIVFEGRTFRIEGVRDALEEGEFIVLLAVEGVAT